MLLNKNSFLFLFIISSILVSCGGGSGAGNLPTVAPLPPADIVNNVKTTNSADGSVSIAWDVLPDTQYKVYVSTDNGQTYGLVADNVTGSEFTDKNIPFNIPLSYSVTASSASLSDSEYSTVLPAITVKSDDVKLLPRQQQRILYSR